MNLPGNKYIQSALARAVIDAGYLDTLGKARPGRHPLLTASPDTLARIRNFSAFISRVQHNFLLGEYPLTFRFLQQFRLSGAVFSAYLDIHQRLKKEKASLQQKEESFISFLDGFLQRQTTSRHLLMRDILSHEAALKKLRDKNAAPAEKNSRRLPGFTIDHPVHIDGYYEVVALHCSPESIATASLKIPRYGKKEKIYCYWLQPGTSGFDHFEIMPPLLALLQRINGKKTIREIASGGKNSPPQTGVIQLFQAMYEMGFIYFTKSAT